MVQGRRGRHQRAPSRPTRYLRQPLEGKPELEMGHTVIRYTYWAHAVLRALLGASNYLAQGLPAFACLDSCKGKYLSTWLKLIYAKPSKVAGDFTASVSTT